MAVLSGRRRVVRAVRIVPAFPARDGRQRRFQLKTKFIDTAEIYDGSQLVSLRSYLKHGLLGDSIVAWVGPCKVSLDHMVDGEDL
ncbi:MAG TPA: DUF366 family protein, partial [Bdellovibrionales bacterium]|nr:DUF366 family protein [Bdellovibrionales bacterium]